MPTDEERRKCALPNYQWEWAFGYHIGYAPERIRVEARNGAREYVPERTSYAVDTGDGVESFRCSECGWDGWCSRDSVTPYCPICGARVVGCPR